MKPLPVLIALAFVIAALAGPADAKSKRQARRAAAPAAAPGFSGTAPARMIEVRPGLWVSSYGCVQDEGYGRYTPCDMNDGLGR